MIQRIVRIENELGLHARAAARLVRLTCRFASEIKLSRLNNQESIDGKSILGILLLAAGRGTELRLTVSGEDEETAVKEIERLFREKFGESQ